MKWSRLNSITIHQLRTFCAVSHHLSYTQAAKELGCQQPTVSALVAELERVTQLTLFEQWGKRLSLTDEGYEFYTHAQKVVNAADEALQALEDLRVSDMPEHKSLRIAADTTVGTYVLPHYLGAFHTLQPGVTLDLLVANRATVRSYLLAGEVDFVIAGRPPDVEGIVTEPFLVNSLVAIAAPSHPLSAQAQVSLPRLAEETFLLREEGSGTRAAVEELFEIVGIPLKIGMVLGHIEAIKQAVAANLGVSVLSEAAVKREVGYGTLTILNVDSFPIQRRWYITRLAQRTLSAGAAEFITFLHESQKSH